MKIPTQEQFVKFVEAHLKKTGTPPTQFGIAATGNRTLMGALRKGTSPTLKTAGRIIDYINGAK